MKKQRKNLVAYLETTLIRTMVDWLKKTGYLVYVCHTKRKGFLSSPTLLINFPITSKHHSHVNGGLPCQN